MSLAGGSIAHMATASLVIRVGFRASGFQGLGLRCHTHEQFGARNSRLSAGGWGGTGFGTGMRVRVQKHPRCENMVLVLAAACFMWLLCCFMTSPFRFVLVVGVMFILLVVCRLSFVVCRLSFVVCRLSFVVCCCLFVVVAVFAAVTLHLVPVPLLPTKSKERTGFERGQLWATDPLENTEL